ncbi:FAD-dependent oxidoreductase [Fructobacillus tropaeoli]|uniref:Or a related oxidoreductase (FadH2) n=1 Tax=Fructobacillus tropaeoli TaxID=709323 RepID=A0ABN9YIA0_9LACO|nr:FAD-dependent oxidoreductase [Fructobacillus tropaeoli]GIC69887.1 FAD-dependent oxidoreductase [Fructobacillus tropaeoli]CAK1225067.1 4-dienoyl-CoA reductase [Fructobacillus tropaeoli]CAK1235541.1 4-dienoyl-CoA reductase [Fructobacillus tropaeoli]
MKVAVIGSTHAGVFAAKQIKADHPDAEVHVFEKNQTVSFLSCGIALWIGDNVSSTDKMFYETPDSMAKQGISMHMQTLVEAADLEAKTLNIKDLVSGAQSEETFDKIVITTGSRAIKPRIPGIDSDKVFDSKTWDNANALKEVTEKVKRIIVIGAGYIGAELAEQLSVNDKEVTLIDGLDRVLANNTAPEFSSVFQKAYEDHGVKLALGQMVSGFEDTADGIKVTTDKGTYEADIAILGIGFLPNTAMFRDQVDMLPNGAIKVNKFMETSVKDVFAAGDSATVFYNPTQKDDYIPLATNAVRQGILVGKNIAEPTMAYQGTQATSAVELYEMAYASTGLTVQSAARKGVEADSVTISEDYRPDFMLSTTPVKASLTWEKGTRRIVGAAFLSKHDISQAANVVSLAIENGMTIDQLSMTDFFFQPNFGQPVNYVSSVAMAAVAKANK